MERYKAAARVSFISLIANLILTIAKLIIGFLSGSAALIADGVHTASDSVSTVIVILGMRIASLPPDEKHPYGHGRAETVATKMLSLILLFIGVNIIFSSVRVLIAGEYLVPKEIALWIAVISIIVKEWMYHYTIRIGKKIQSQALIADAWHHRSDSFSSIASSLGILFARIGYPIFDPITAAFVAIFIIQVGWKIFRESVDEIMDAQVDEELLAEITDVINNVVDVQTVDRITVHRYGSELHIDVTISASDELTLTEGHELIHRVEESLNKSFTNATHIDVHIEPIPLKNEQSD